MASDYPDPPSHLAVDLEGVRRTSLDDQAAFGLESHPADASIDPDDPHVELKRPRACEPCRQLKVRCDPDPNHPDGSCRRCAKARRACVVTAPSRKRQKKTDSRVTELERKIDALTATLQASQNSRVATTQIASTSPPLRDEPPPTTRRWLPEGPDAVGSKRNHDGLLVSQHPRPDNLPADHAHRLQPSKQWRGPYAGDTEPPPVEPKDVIDRGIVDLESADAAFNRYVTQMADEMPMVVFPPGTTMRDVRRTKPTLFLCIIAVSIGPFNKDAQVTLLSEFYHAIADRVVVKGDKSLELIQALLVSSIWYIPPDNMEELKFYQLIHMAIVLAMDMGMNRRSGGDLKPLVRIREIIAKKPQGSSSELDGPEARRTWIGCYFLGIQVATALRRMQLVKWQPYMDESLHILETHPDALPSDRQVIWWAKLAYVMEQAGVQLTAEDPHSEISFADSKTRYTIKAFANQLAQFRRDIPEEFWTAPLAHTKYAIDLFVHESAMGVDCTDSNMPDMPSSAIAPLIDSLTTCIRSIHQAIDCITTISPERLTCIPTLAVARTSYPVVSLIKIYSLLKASDSRISQVIDMQSLKLEYYLDKVINHYGAAAELSGGRVAAKFGNIVMMLRSWFLKKKENGPELREVFGSEMRSDTPSDRPSMSQATTPLHLLSEVATGDPANRPSPTGSLSHRPRHGYENHHSPSSLNQEGTSVSAHYASSGPPGRLNSMASVKSDPIPSTAAWPTTSSFTPSVPGPGPNNQNVGSRGFYQPYAPGNPPHSYTDLQIPAPGTAVGPGASSYPNMTNMGVPLSQPMGPMPQAETGESVGADNLFMLGTMMEDGLFTFPLSFDENFQF